MSAVEVNDVMELQEVALRVWQNLVERPAGPLGLRFIVQPIVAGALAMRDGMRDARTGHRPYFWTILADPAQRMSLLQEGLASVAKVMAIAIVLDGVYQWVVLKTFYPVEAIIVALALAYVPYLLIRGPAMRIARWWNERRLPTERLRP